MSSLIFQKYYPDQFQMYDVKRFRKLKLKYLEVETQNNNNKYKYFQYLNYGVSNKTNLREYYLYAPIQL